MPFLPMPFRSLPHRLVVLASTVNRRCCPARGRGMLGVGQAAVGVESSEYPKPDT